MKISIIGGGSIGLLCSAYFCSLGEEVTLYTRREEQASEIVSKGLTLYKNRESHHFSINASPISEFRSHGGLVILAVKQYQLEEVLKEISIKLEKGTLLFLQNGMGHLSLLDKLTKYNVLIGIVEHGALKTSDYEVIHTGEGTLKVALYRGKDPYFNTSLETFNKNGFPIEKVEDWYEIMANKLVVNAVINPLTALYRVKNGELLKNPYFLHNMKLLFNEAVSVLEVNRHQLWSTVEMICKKTAENRSSMLCDIEKGYTTEIDAISGYILAEANRQNRTLSLTSFLYKSIKGIEIMK
ncbi:2-dehydropantoate 2-reductase [Bacillus taeanensis]|uniref:2-dehydropantoate 2-reductase n=1 Tax=Bacillus taeanensis TaxID=273032 RepID=UPI0015F0A12B|nr:2-dehydropantoate 2-reductase [Bacillus taeanensis]